MSHPRIAVLLPCYNEGLTIGAVIRQCQKVLPQAVIYVYDNNSTDHTVQEASEAGADVRHESIQGKGAVLRRMFADIEADLYVVCDGDGTYDLSALPLHVHRMMQESSDMLVGVRDTTHPQAFRAGHRWGNVVLTKLASLLFRHPLRDLLSGYRIFSRRFVKSFLVQSKGFEIETEMTIHAVTLGASIIHVPISYGARPQGSQSKLSTLRDGVRIVATMSRLWAQTHPLASWGSLGVLGLGVGAWHLLRVDPTSELTWLLSFLGCLGGLLCLGVGAALKGVHTVQLSLKRLTYMGALPAPQAVLSPSLKWVHTPSV